MSTGLRRKAVLLLVASVLVIPWTASAGPRFGSDQALDASVSVFLEDLLGQAWSYFMGILNKEGCHIDPHGRCTPQPIIQTDEGCHIDPHGGCRS